MPACRQSSAQSPPFLILYATGETKALQRQSQVLHDALSRCPAKAIRGWFSR